LYTKCQYENLKEIEHSEDLAVVIKMDLKEITSRQGPMAGSCKHHSEPPDFTQRGEFLE
jgi:hypothetical protein